MEDMAAVANEISDLIAGNLGQRTRRGTRRMKRRGTVAVGCGAVPNFGASEFTK
jgi:hypothetical protein